MQSDDPVQIEFTPRFRRDLRTLAKRYRSIRDDLQLLIEQLQAGELPGDQIAGLGSTVFKVRVKNRDIQKGKSAGYRVIYYLKTSNRIILITMYSKSDQSDITADEIRESLIQLERPSDEPE